MAEGLLKDLQQARHQGSAMRKSGYEVKTPDRIGGQFDSSIEREIMWPRRPAGPSLPIDLFLPHFGEFCIPTFLRTFLRQDPIFKKSNSDANRLLVFVISQK
jgi:hypothetical protein